MSKVIPSNTYGCLTVIKELGTKNEKIWLCKCNCGNQYQVRQSRILKPQHYCKSCRPTISPDDRGLTYLYAKYRWEAKRRKIEFDLSRKYMGELVKRPCFYCGEPPSQKVVFSTGEFFYNGLDRRNNSKGYHKNNVLPCCWFCNKAKANKNQEEFLLWVSKVVTFQNAKAA